VLDAEAGHALEPGLIAGDQRQVPRQRDGRNHHVVAPDQRALSPELRANQPVLIGRSVVEVVGLESFPTNSGRQDAPASAERIGAAATEAYQGIRRREATHRDARGAGCSREAEFVGKLSSGSKNTWSLPRFASTRSLLRAPKISSALTTLHTHSSSGV
jgi:hypothetical protein